LIEDIGRRLYASIRQIFVSLQQNTVGTRCKMPADRMKRFHAAASLKSVVVWLPNPGNFD
jgi:hypothetical protein